MSEQLTQEQFSEIGRMVDRLVELEVFDSVADERVFLQQLFGVKIKSRHGLSERQADWVIEQFKYRWPEVFSEQEA